VNRIGASTASQSSRRDPPKLVLQLPIPHSLRCGASLFLFLARATPRILKLDWLRLIRGPNGARDEFLLAGTAQNLRKLAKLDTGAELPGGLKIASLSKPPRRQFSPSIDFDLLPGFFNKICQKRKLAGSGSPTMNVTFTLPHDFASLLSGRGRAPL
jgi:hypothetical protein